MISRPMAELLIQQMATDFKLKRRYNGEYGGDCPVCGYKNSFTLSISEDAKPLWNCFAGECNLFKAIESLAYKTRTSQYFKAPPKPTSYSKRKTNNFEKILRETWEIKGTLAEKYLSSRKITDPLPATLRFHPHLYHSKTKKKYPAMVAQVNHYDHEEPVAIHRTYLKPDGTGKADIDPSKMSLGPLKGAGVFLGNPANIMAVSEGIETGLSFQMMRDIPTIAALSCAGMKNLILPPLPKAAVVFIAADRDPQGLLAAKKAADRWNSEDRKVYISVPEFGTDFNDVLQVAEKTEDGYVRKS